MPEARHRHFEEVAGLHANLPAPAATNPGPSVGGQTIEDLVKEMLRPMLKEWLDKAGPEGKALVDGLVAGCGAMRPLPFEADGTIA